MKISQLQKIVDCLDMLTKRLDNLEALWAKNNANEDADDREEEVEADEIYKNRSSDFMTSSGQHKTAPQQPFVDNVRDEKAFPHLIHGDPAV